MSRAASFLVRNWPLKIGAIVLATVLYSGLVLGQNVRTWTGTLPVEAIRPPSGATLLSDVAPVTTIRYRASLEVGLLSPSSFSATVDLSDVSPTPGGPPVAVPVTLIALNPAVQIVDFEPREVQVRLDPVEEREFPVTVTLGTVPDSVTVGPSQVEPGTVTLRGASSRVNAVAAVVARVSIDASALNVDRDVLLTPVDANGNEVPAIEIEPERVRVRIAVAQELATRTLPVVPQIVGAPAPGYRITAVTVEPLVMTVSGEAAIVARLQNAPTNPIDIAGRTTDLEAEVTLALPAGVTASESDRVRVRLTIAEETGTQTFTTGIVLDNESAGMAYGLGLEQVSVTLSGPLRVLQAVSGADLVASADVSGLLPGLQTVPLTFEPPPELEVVSIDPEQLTLVVSELATPAPSP